MIRLGSSLQATTVTTGGARRAAVAALLLLLRGSVVVVEGHPHQQKHTPGVSASAEGREKERAQPTTTPPSPLSRDASHPAFERHPEGNANGDGGGGDDGSSILTRQASRNDHERKDNFARRSRELTSTVDGSGDCSDEFTSCGGDSTCLSCVNEHVNMNECVETYHASGSDGTVEDAGDMTLCESLATSFCCGAYDVYIADAVSCVDDDLVIEYWTCSLESNGCSVEDLPCYGVDLSTMLESEREAELEKETAVTTDSDTSSGQASTGNSSGDTASVANDADTNGVTRRTPLGIFGAGSSAGIVVVGLVSCIGAFELSMVDAW